MSNPKPAPIAAARKATPAFFAVLLTFLLVSLACEMPPFLGEQTIPSGEVLFQDDFSNPSSGWTRVTQASGETNYSNGVYRILVNASRTDLWARPGLDFTDVQIEVDATKVGGSDNNDFGVICRMADLNRFYFFYISSDGYYGIGKFQEGQYSLIGMEAMLPSDVIHQGDASNHLRADCTGSTLTLYVNGAKVGEAQDSEYSTGDVGLIAGSYETPGTDIHFDNFTVLKP